MAQAGEDLASSRRPMAMLAPAALFALSNLNILFVGNSLTAGNDLPGMVKALLQSQGRDRQVSVQYHPAAHLNDVTANRNLVAQLTRGTWNVVVLQGASVSMSHKYTYPQDGGIALAKAAIRGGAKCLLYSEWSRRGENETEYTE